MEKGLPQRGDVRPLYGRTCDGKPEHPLDVQDIPTTEEEDVLHELRFERDCCSF